MAARRPLDRPAFYALAPGGWRDLLTLLHPPYTAWHLSYVAIGAAVAPHLDGGRLAWTLVAFLLAVGVCAHALDELHGRPLGTRLADGTLRLLGGASLAGAVAIGIFGALTVSLSLLAPVAAGAFIVLAYNLELFGGRFHSELWFAAAWGGFPALVGYWACAGGLRAEALPAIAACFALSVAQRRLSSPVRQLRRHTAALTGTHRLRDGTEVSLDPARIAAPMEAALKAAAAAVVLLAVALVLWRL